MKKPSLLLIGAGGHARACIDVIEQNGKFNIFGLIGEPTEVGKSVFEYPVLGTDADLTHVIEHCRNALIAVGHIKSPNLRIKLFKQAQELGFVFLPIISSSAYVSSHAVIGAGTIVMHGAMVNAGATVGDNCIVNSKALIEHGTTVENHCHISTGAILNGEVHVGEGSFIGSGSLIKEGVSLGSHSLVGMGLKVRHSQPDNTRFARG
jgi:sugar O-acyltransferase (sialic acid O-acetyltransferase NeuD family)